MARSGNKAAVVLCMDVRFTTSNSLPGEESPFELAKKVMTMFVQRQVFAESKDEIALVLFGTDGTENALAGEDQYQNITVHRHLKLPDFDLLEDIESKIQPGSQQADFLDALVVCMDLIQQETVGKKFEKRHIEVFTDLSSPFSRDQLDIIIHNLKKSGISLQFFLPFPVGKKDGTGDRGDGNLLSDHHGPSFPLKGISEQQKEGIRLVKKVMMSLEGEDGLEEIYSFSESLRQLCVFKKIERRSVPWPCQLTIGSNLSIKIVAYKSILQEKVKKCWTVVDARTQKKEDIQKETVYCLNDDDETEVPKEDTIQGFRYGSDIIPFSKVDEEQMKYKLEGKCFSVLGFCRSSQVHMKYFMGNQVLKVFATKDDEAAAVALSSLIHALDELDMVAVVRYAYDRRANPQVGVAFPYIRDFYECLVYVQLPFMEDLRQYMFSSLKNNRKCTPTEAQLSAVDALIDSMSLVKKDEEEGTIEDLFPTSKIPNPQFQRLFQYLEFSSRQDKQDLYFQGCLLHRALHPQEPLPPVQQHVLNMLDPPTEVTAKCQVPVSKIKTLFPLTEVLKKKDQVTAQDIFQDNHEEGPTSKKLKTEGDEAHFSVCSLAEGSVTRVGSVDPAENFRVLVRQKKTSFEEASHQLINHIEQFLDTNETLYFMKSMDCIRVFREEAIQFSEEQHFNSFLKALREKVEVKQLNHFWEIVIQDGITLITKDEASGSSVTAEEAKKFLAPKEYPDEDTAAECEEGGDVDDLLDLI
ncbi:X-ray repair cross-complementing protein 5 isoform X2 [Physeter macrocephalus]|uniref:X-ray repair cross-complementing protein 5 n=1 Tax=Physeter macrocephalus TaxID=9755 RepID=A0A455B070_PHYMC|nr:X-ray repair cross-complementing protein 5 isoform X2 [Physeter catodon]|eukprot:XP_028337486.1 X-ray repair cross-complementing protein 5 isoform X2 [Physeter catodon]